MLFSPPLLWLCGAALGAAAARSTSPAAAFVHTVHCPHRASTRGTSHAPPRSNAHTRTSRWPRLGQTTEPLEDAVDEQLLESLRAMRVTELKSALDAVGVSTKNALEKEELVQRLFRARLAGGSVGDDGGKKKKKKKKRRRDDDDDAAAMDVPASASGDNVSAENGNAVPSSSPTSGAWTVTAPFVYYELTPSQSVAAQNAADVYIRPSPGRYAAVRTHFAKRDGSCVDLMLLVDTACSGLVLSPTAVERANRQCPGVFQTSAMGATMTMAGSSQGAAVATWDASTKMKVGGVDIDHANAAACQDIGALPAGLDGIVGLSFLDRFACVDFDFVRNELRLDRADPNPPVPNMNDVVARGPLSSTKLRIYTADVTLDGRGPVKLLVDTGAASTFLNWKGVADLRLSSTSPRIAPLREQIGAMGADNVALRLTHRFQLKRRWNVVAENTAVGDFCPGIKLQENEVSDIDIGDLPVLEALQGDGVGGILGADLLMMCDVVRFSGLNGASPSMILMKKE